MKILIYVICSIAIILLLIIVLKVGYGKILYPLIACLFIIEICCDIFFIIKKKKKNNRNKSNDTMNSNND